MFNQYTENDYYHFVTSDRPDYVPNWSHLYMIRKHVYAQNMLFPDRFKDRGIEFSVLRRPESEFVLLLLAFRPRYEGPPDDYNGPINQLQLADRVFQFSHFVPTIGEVSLIKSRYEDIAKVDKKTARNRFLHLMEVWTNFTPGSYPKPSFPG